MSAPPSIEVLQIGRQSHTVAIVNGLASDPDRWREDAVGGNYAYLGDFYPGRRRPVSPAYFQDIGNRLGAVLQAIFGCTKSLSVDRALYSILSTEPGSLSLAQRIPHVDDVSPTAFAMIHYLAREPFGGTAFFRHRNTGLERISPAHHQQYLASLNNDLEVMGAPNSAYIDGDSPIFDQIGSVEFSYNRAVIYPGNLLHCSIVPQGMAHPDDPAAGRLTIAGFFRAE